MDEQLKQLEARIKALEDKQNQNTGSELLKLPLDPTSSGSMNQTFINTSFDKFQVKDLYVNKLHFQGGPSTVSAGVPVTISGGVIPMIATFMAVDTEGGAASDDLDNITTNGVSPGTIVILHAANNARTVVVKDGTLILAGDFTMDSSSDTITLIMGITNWRELARSDNAA